MHYMHTFLAPAWLACAFLARVLRIARASLDRVLSGTRSASLCSYREGSYKATLTVVEYLGSGEYLSTQHSCTSVMGFDGTQSCSKDVFSIFIYHNSHSTLKEEEKGTQNCKIFQKSSENALNIRQFGEDFKTEYSSNLIE